MRWWSSRFSIHTNGLQRRIYLASNFSLFFQGKNFYHPLPIKRTYRLALEIIASSIEFYRNTVLGVEVFVDAGTLSLNYLLN